MFISPLQAQEYSLDRTPDWVRTLPAKDVEVRNAGDGVTYILVDHQWKIDEDRQEHFYHYAEKALNISGVETASQITIDFDPAFESLTLHRIVVHRDGNVVDRIGRARMDVIQREKDLENQIYDGSKTLNIFLEDIRVGDIIEYSYSKKGANPAYSGHFATRLQLRWAVPVEQVHYRLLWPSSRRIHIKNYRTTIKPQESISSDHIEYIWQDEPHEALVIDNNTPDWFSPYPVVHLSDFSSWGEVVEWALPFYAPVPVSQVQKELIDEILKNAQTEEERVLGALRFVQDEIRYLGIEFGERSYKPNDPDTVLRQRFGDCKDKSRLLIGLLRGMGIDAYSALVNSYTGEQINNGLPSPKSFNHVIVLVCIDGKNYWLDPTLNHQRGNLKTLYTPNYEYALVISENSSELKRLSDDISVRHSKVVEEKIDITDDLKDEASYVIKTHLERYYADKMRQQFTRTNLSELQKSYLNFTASYFPSVQVAEKMEIDDAETENRLSVTEHYRIPELWTVSEDDRYIFADFEPFLIHDTIQNVDALNRTMPYAVSHPVRLKQTTRIIVGEGSNFENEYTEVEDKAFRFIKQVKFTNNVLEIEYLYESLKDNVLPEDIKTYSMNIQKVLSLADYRIQKTNPAIDYGQYHFKSSDVNWPLAAGVLLFFSCSTYLLWRFVYLYNPTNMLLDDIDHSLAGLKGWLILPGFALLATPVRIFLESRELWYTFSAQQWSILADSVSLGMLTTIVIEIFCNVALLMTAVFLIFLFFQRRYTFPRLFIIFLACALGISILDTLLVLIFDGSWFELDQETIGSLIKQAIYAAIWISYFNSSRRVQATFTERRAMRQRHTDRATAPHAQTVT